MVEETMMSPLQTLDQELKNLGPKSRTENPVFLKLIQWIPPRPIEHEKEHALFLDVLKKISLFLNEADSDPFIKRNAKAREQIEGHAQYGRMIEELIVHYERDGFPADRSTPQDMLAFLMEQHGLSEMDIAEDLGGQPNVSNVLSGKRELNLRQIRRLAVRFHISPAVFKS